MENLLKTLGSIAGIGGISIGLILILFKDIIKKKIFPQLTKKQAYKIIRLIVILSFIISVIGMTTYLIKEVDHKKNPENNSTTVIKDTTLIPTLNVKSSGANSPAINTEGDVHINYSNQEEKDKLVDSINKIE